MREEELYLTPYEYHKLREKYPDKVPVFVFRSKGKSDIPDINKHKYLVQSTFSVGNLLYIIRKQLSLAPDKALFLFIGNTLPVASMLIGEVYNKYRSSDGALRVYYASESTFGC